jgi:hypothetical protein
MGIRKSRIATQFRTNRAVSALCKIIILSGLCGLGVEAVIFLGGLRVLSGEAF